MKPAILHSITFRKASAVGTCLFLLFAYTGAIAQRAQDIPYQDNPTPMNAYLLFLVVLPAFALLFYYFFWKKKM
jgi:RsiW-degrading membrane proteinase PrsW (M82 family)